uniref:Uncharacterized protein n=1 Tax=Arundo donax TaxID=35708 RepID=A0A0A9H3I0_ARUDO
MTAAVHKVNYRPAMKQILIMLPPLRH